MLIDNMISTIQGSMQCFKRRLIKSSVEIVVETLIFELFLIYINTVNDTQQEHWKARPHQFSIPINPKSILQNASVWLISNYVCDLFSRLWQDSRIVRQTELSVTVFPIFKVVNIILFADYRRQTSDEKPGSANTRLCRFSKSAFVNNRTCECFSVWSLINLKYSLSDRFDRN